MPDLRSKDLTRCAVILAEAAGKIDGRVLKTVDTAFGRADVIVDDKAADVDLHGGPSIHLRWGEVERR